MIIREFSCDRHGRFERYFTSGSAPETDGCPACGAASLRLLSAPSIRRSGAHAGIVTAMDRADKSRYEPEVVSSLPRSGMPGNRANLAKNPAWGHLPRP